MRRRLMALTLSAGMATATACVARSNDAPEPSAEVPPATLTLPASARDSSATLAALASFRVQVDSDTARMAVISRPLDLGADATGTLTAWRAGRSWQRLHVSGEGTGFRSDDTYWIHDGALVGAQLTITRPKQPARIDQVWFRGPDLYRWVDADGWLLSHDAQSTKSELTALRGRLKQITQLLPSIDSEPQASRNP